MDAVSQEIKSLQSYLATLKPVLNAGKIKDTKAKIEALNTELAKLNEQYKFYVSQVQKQDENSAKLQSQIDTFINAISKKKPLNTQTTKQI
jgi:chromosome segregation ATPase